MTPSVAQVSPAVIADSCQQREVLLCERAAAPLSWLFLLRSHDHRPFLINTSVTVSQVTQLHLRSLRGPRLCQMKTFKEEPTGFGGASARVSGP